MRRFIAASWTRSRSVLADHWVDRAAHRLTGLLQRSAGQAEQDA